MFSNGLRWLKADFHLHTYKDKEFTFDESENTFIKSYVKKLSEENINIGIITNHNKFDKGEYNALRKRAKKESILILPGVELSVKEGKNGIHCLVVFSPEQWLSNGENHIEKFLISAFSGTENRENKNTSCNYDIPELLNELDKLSMDYFIIFAHVDQKSGLFIECGGGLIESLSKKHNFQKRVLGLQKAHCRDNLNNFKQWTGYELACVEGSDPKSISEIGKGKHNTYLKVGDLSFQSVKFALQDFKNRVSSVKLDIKRSYIESISYLGGRLDKAKIPFSPSLNTVIGIRGSGKSAVLETLRYAFNIPADIDSTYKEELVKHVLGSGGKVIVNVVDSYGKKFRIEKIVGEKTNIIDENDEVINLPMDSIINNPLYFGQKDLSFKNEGYEFELLKKLIGSKLENHQHYLDDINNSIIDDIRTFLEYGSISDKINELEGRNNALSINIERFKEQGVDKKLEKQASYKADLRELIDLIENIDEPLIEIKQSIDKYEKKTHSIVNYTSTYNAALIERVKKTYTEILDKLSSVKEIYGQIDKKIDILKRERTVLEENIKSLADEFAEIKRSIDNETIKPEDYLTYIEEIEKNNKKIKTLRNKKATKLELESRIRTNIKNRNECLRVIYDEYVQEINKVNHSQVELKIKIHFKGDKKNFVDSMQRFFQGSGITRSKYIDLASKFSDYSALLEDFLFDNGKIINQILTTNEYSKISNLIIKNYPELINSMTSNLVEINYHEKLLEKHSIGQRVSAIILLILSQKDNDLVIIDQPEDDLDNQVIYSEVISTLKERKNDIQFVFATHNANIPVLGDAECIISTEYKPDKIHFEVGNIDSPATHSKIVDIMEGGEEAFRRRKMIYSNWGKGIE